MAREVEGGKKRKIMMRIWEIREEIKAAREGGFIGVCFLASRIPTNLGKKKLRIYSCYLNQSILTNTHVFKMIGLESEYFCLGSFDQI